MSKRCKSVSNYSIYEDNLSYSREMENPSVLYNGGIESYEDPADYYRKQPIKVVRLG